MNWYEKTLVGDRIQYGAGTLWGGQRHAAIAWALANSSNAGKLDFGYAIGYTKER